MQFSDLESMCTRACRHVFFKTKIWYTALLVTVSALVGFCALSIALWSFDLLKSTLLFLPFVATFLSIMTVGVFLIRAYHDEVKRRKTSYKTVLLNCRQELVTSARFFQPFIALFFLLCVGDIAYFFLRMLPGLQGFFDLVFVLGAILWTFTLFLLCAGSCFFIFCITPSLALKPFSNKELLLYSKEAFQSHLLLRLSLFLVAVAPLVLSAFLLWLSLLAISYDTIWPIGGLFVMVEVAALLSPAIIFFFNMAAETHILIQTKESGKRIMT